MPAPEGYIEVAANPGWYLKEGADAGQESSWIEAPPPGFEYDPNNTGWALRVGGDPQNQADWWHDSRVVDWWTTTEVAAAAQAPAPNVEANWPKILSAMGVWGIAQPLVGVGIVGTIAQESGSFLPVEEAWWLSPAARNRYYNDTTQHAAYGGGGAYHGRGFIQLTHVGNYRDAQDAINARAGLGLDLVGNPDLALDADVAAHILCWFFDAKGIVPFCESQAWSETRRRIWGAYDLDGTHGLGKLQYAAQVLIPIAQQRGFLA